MATDSEQISTEDHELNYVLRKWNKAQSNNNRKKLADMLKDFNQVAKYRKSNREDFYKYADENKSLVEALDA